MDNKLETKRIPVGLTNAGKGRPKGVPNKTTLAAKEAFQFAFDKLGGGQGLASWASSNPDEFYKLYARLIPVDNTHSGPEGAPLNIKVTFGA